MICLCAALATATLAKGPALSKGQTLYLPVYHRVYIDQIERDYDPTVTLVVRNVDPHHPITVFDGEHYDEFAVKMYVVNAAKTGTGISITGNVSKIDDGLVDIFTLDAENLQSLSGAVHRMLNLNTKKNRDWMRQGREVSIDTDPDQPVWTDGEYTGRTPVSLKVLPAVLPVIVP